MSDDPITAAILRLASERGPGKTICPSDAAKALAAEGEDWRVHMKPVRAKAVELAHGGAVEILRKGKPVDPDDFKGIYRIGIKD